MIVVVIVIKIGGDLLKGGKLNEDLINDMKSVKSGENIVVVHGGGDIVTEIAEKLGKKQVFVTSPEGFKSRYTDRETAAIYAMVMAGKLNKEITVALQSRGLPALGISGLDGGLLKAERKKKLVIIDERGRKRIIEGGYTGRIISVDTQVLTPLMEAGFIPVVAPVALGDEYEILNVDGDRAAANIAGALKANALILLTDVEGVMVNEVLVKEVHLNDVDSLIRKLGPGMITKMYAAAEAVRLGASKSIITSGLKAAPITSALAGRTGTFVVP
ncbi:MAG: [LysW]-aminoadipate/[LysW]-glutamate kinase [Candidatus Nezhaarchaeales archaeon]